MGFHAVYTVASYQSVGWAFYQFLTDVSNDVTQIVNDGTMAVWMDLTETNSDHDSAPGNFGWGTPTKADAFGDGSFIVAEPQFDNASGARRWQVKIERDVNEWYVTCSPNEGFSTSTEDFGSQPLTPKTQWWNITPAGSDELYLSSTDDGTWENSNGTQKYGYLRAIAKDASSPTNVLYAFYAGGYIPFDEEYDLDPFVMLAREPRVENNANSNSWGYGTAGSSCLSRAPWENGQAVSSMVSAGYAFLSCNWTLQHSQRSQTRAGDEVEAQVYVHLTDYAALGYFHPNTMVGVSDGITNWTVNATADRISIQDLSHSWEP